MGATYTIMITQMLLKGINPVYILIYLTSYLTLINLNIYTIHPVNPLYSRIHYTVLYNNL